MGVDDVFANILKRRDEPEEDPNDASDMIVFGTTATELNIDALGNSIN